MIRVPSREGFSVWTLAHYPLKGTKRSGPGSYSRAQIMSGLHADLESGRGSTRAAPTRIIRRLAASRPWPALRQHLRQEYVLALLFTAGIAVLVSRTFS